MSEEGGDESPPRPKRRIKRVMIVSSSSGSDSEGSIAMIRTRRKKLRVISDPEESDSSGSSVVCGNRRRRAVPKLRDSELDSDSSDCASDHSKKAVPSTSKTTQSGFASDSSEGNSDKCSICLLRFTNQEIGTPISCEHIFCLDCITEWSKNVNTCPVDRITFESIVVRACIGGRVLRTEPVKEQHPSVEILLSTMCEICGRADNEEFMLLCDGCDLGYHIQCLTPPLSEVPAAAQWLCPDCDILDIMDFIDISEVDDLFSEASDLSMPLGPRPSLLRAPRNVRRSARSTALNQPSTSNNRGGNRLSVEEAPTTSRGIGTVNRSITTRKAQKRKRTSRRRTKKVVIEYEIEENGKFPITRRVTRTVRKRKGRRRHPRTAARRSLVQASVRARLAALRAAAGAGGAGAGAGGARAGAGAGGDLAARRGRAAIPALSLYGDSHQFEYFSDDEVDASEGASTAVAMRPTSSILSAYRQARRKMITIPSPPHASSAPDVLSNILESQTLLHSKKSIVSVSVDGNVNIKLQKSMSKPHQNQRETKKEKMDLSNNEDCTKKVPSYPGQSRGGGGGGSGGGGGGWGGGYRGSYGREHGANNFNRGTYENNYSSAYQGRQPGNNMLNSNYQNNNMRRDSDPEFFDNFSRRSHQFPPNEESYFDRQRRNPQNDSNRPQNYSNTVRHSDQNQGRFSTGPAWQPYGNAPPASRQDVPPATARHSFGGFENPLDMRMGQMPSRTSNLDSYSRSEPLQQEKPQPSYNPMVEPYQSLPQPPVFNFPKSVELEKSEDERSDSGLVIDTEKYDPTEPTNDDDSGDEHRHLPEPSTASVPRLAEIPVSGPEADTLPPQTPPARSVQSILAGIDTSGMNVPANVLDSAVRQVLQEHRSLLASPADKHGNDKSDEESDGDCPNFSIYSATSVHIANNTSSLADEMERARPQHDSMEDLVQEDDDIPTPEAASPMKSDTEIPVEEQEELHKVDVVPIAIKSVPSNNESSIKNKTEEEYKEKVSKRCPITTNTRNPIKIKLNTSSLIKRVSLYDEEDVSQDVTDRAEVVSDEKLESEKPSSPKLNREQEELFDRENVCHIEKRLSGSTVDVVEEALKAQSENEDVSIESSTIAPENTKGADEKKEDNLEDKKVHDDVFGEDRSDDSGHGNTEMSDSEICLSTQSAKEVGLKDRDDEDNIEKMTESISETEDERSYTPCLDENKPKDASFEIEKDRALEGLDTEMISEEEGNEMFSENERPPSVQSKPSPPPPKLVELPEPEVIEKRKNEKKKSDGREEGKKKKKKDSKKEGKGKNKKKGEVTFKKLSKSGKERNYRERDKEDKKKKERRSSSEPPESKRKRKEKRKDLERYDVRTLVTEKRRTVKDPFGRDVSPRARSPSPSASPARSAARSPPARSPRPAGPKPAARRRRSASRGRRSISRARRSISRARRSISRARRSISRVHPSPLRSRRTPSRPRRSPIRRSISRLTPVGIRESPRRRSPIRPGRSPAPRRTRRSPSPRSLTPRVSPRRSLSARRRSPPRKRRRRSGSRPRRRRTASASPRRLNKKKKRTRSERSPSRRRVEKSTHRKVRSRSLELSPSRPIPSPSIDSQLLSPRTPPPEPQDASPPLHLPSDDNARRRRREPARQRRRLRDLPGPSKEVFTSGDNILVSVSFKDQELGEETERRRRRENKRDRRRRRRNNVPPETETAKPVAIIDLERSPFRELTPSPKNVIVLSDSEPGERDAAEPSAPPPAAAPPAAEPPFLSGSGPKTPPEPSGPDPGGPPVAAVAALPAPPPGERSPSVGPEQPDAHSPDAYDPFEPTRSASASPGSGRSPPSEGPPPTPPRTMITLEAAQRTNMSADEVLDRRPLSPAEKVLALLQSTRDHSPEPPPGDAAEGGAGAAGAAGAGGAGGGGAGAAAGAPVAAAAPRIVLPSPTRAPPKLFPGKPSPIKSNPVKPMQALRPPSDGGASPYSPGSSDFGDLFEPRDSFESILRARRNKNPAAKVPVKLNKKKGKTQVGVKLDDDNLKILDELPSSAVEMQVKSKFLRKLNRQERVVEEVKLVLKPHYNKKHVTKDEYKHILRRAVPKICHNKTGEINPAKIQSLVEAYVKRLRKRRKLGLA